MNCNKCGNEIKRGEKFCANCGTPVDLSKNKSVKAGGKTVNKKIAVIICSVVILAIIAVTTSVIINCRNKAYNEDDAYVSENTVDTAEDSTGTTGEVIPVTEVDPNDYSVVMSWSDIDTEEDNCFVVSQTADTYNGKMKYGYIKDNKWVAPLSENYKWCGYIESPKCNACGKDVIITPNAVFNVKNDSLIDFDDEFEGKSFYAYSYNDEYIIVNTGSENVSGGEIYFISKDTFNMYKKFSLKSSYFDYNDTDGYTILSYNDNLIYVVIYNNHQWITDTKGNKLVDLGDYGTNVENVEINDDSTVSFNVVTDNGKFRLTVDAKGNVTNQDKIESGEQ